MKNSRKGGAVAGLLATIAVLVLLFAGIGLSMGWVEMSDSPDKSTIEINKTELKEDTDKAVKATEEFINKSAESIEDGVKEVTPDDNSDTITPVPDPDRTAEPETGSPE
ncbi:hypothetical protein [Bremerella cremea]|uniref:hypothetical protein n=1 Tax=Bremerella cremea TaxID=1031537 RepID=UPI0031EE0FB8